MNPLDRFKEPFRFNGTAMKIIDSEGQWVCKPFAFSDVESLVQLLNLRKDYQKLEEIAKIIWRSNLLTEGLQEDLSNILTRIEEKKTPKG